ncbi:MAG: hypothetical protein RL226_1602 [Bacteroidota bacterium]
MRILRNIGAVIVGLFVGSLVNGLIVGLNGKLIPLPEGVDVSTPEGLAAAMSKFEAIHFLMPFLAHALGTLVGALLASFIYVGNRMIAAMVVATLFFFGGLYMVVILDAPMWFNALDLVVAYFPMAYIGAKLAGMKKSLNG